MSDYRVKMTALLFALFAWVVWVVNAYNAESQPQTREITLTDGTPCVINKNGGIACHWKEKQ